jgi:hypothetical protein
MYGATLGNHRYNFSNLATLLAKASPLRSGDILAGIAAQSGEERVAAQFALADLPLRTFFMAHKWTKASRAKLSRSQKTRWRKRKRQVRRKRRRT